MKRFLCKIGLHRWGNDVYGQDRNVGPDGYTVWCGRRGCPVSTRKRW